MTDRRNHAERLLPAAAGVLCLAVFAPAFAGPPPDAPTTSLQEAGPFGALVGRRAPRDDREDRDREVERYAISADGRVFLFAHDGVEGRIKFLCHQGDPRLDCRIDPDGPAEEIFEVTADRGPRGDLIFKNREGEPLLRVAPYGGATVFWPGDQYGQAASKSYGEDKGALELPSETRADAHRRAQAAAANLSALTGSPIIFDVGSVRRDRQILADAVAPEMNAPQPAAAFAPARAARADAADAETAEADDEPVAEETKSAAKGARPRLDASVLADAVARAAAGLQEVAGDPTGVRVLGARLAEVRFMPGPGPSLSLENKILTIVYNPEGGLDGRPSSSAVSHFLEENL